MKYVLVIGSGMADIRLPHLANHTPMEVLALNAFDRVAGCFLGRALTIPHGMPADSENAILSIFGYAPQTYGGSDTALPDFKATFGHHGSVISALPMVHSIARRAGLKTPAVEGATGSISTSYEAKVECALSALASGDDFVAVHINAPDAMAHAGDLAGKLEAVQNVEYRVVMRLLNQLMGNGEDFRLMLICDHPTCLATRSHSSHPVPYAVLDSRTVRKALDDGKEPPTRKFSEHESACEPVLMDGTELMKILFEKK